MKIIPYTIDEHVSRKMIGSVPMFPSPESSTINGMGLLAQRVAMIRWIVSLALFWFVSGFETLEHIIIEGEAPSWRFSFEILFFGVIGPALVFVILSWIRHNLRQLILAYEEIHSLNTNLETRIQVRTEELLQANDKLRQLDRLKSEFVSLVSHELRTPLTNIHGGIELVLQQLEPCATGSHQVLLVVQSEAVRLTRMVKHILDVSALQAGQMQLNQGAVILRPLVNKVMTQCVQNSDNHELTLDIPTQLPPIWADEDRLADVLANLINNAIKYSPEGGEIKISASPENSHIHLIVKDSGIGIPLEEHDRMFQPFFRGKSTVDSVEKGYGLGLYFCHQLIHAQNGRIWVESCGEPGQGAAFHLTLPVDQGGEA
jgi:signal transduction histidine kinase